MIRRPPRSTHCISSAASDVYKRQVKNHEVRTHKSAEDFPYEEHLAYKVAEVAADPVEVPAETTDMIINRIIDNAAVAMASVARGPVTSARIMAQAHPVSKGGATVFGVDGTYSTEWAALANGTAVRELDYHDTFLAAEYSHPGDNIPVSYTHLRAHET